MHFSIKRYLYTMVGIIVFGTSIHGSNSMIQSHAISDLQTGDINQDGTVDEKDLSLLHSYNLELIKTISNAADLNEDGVINGLDEAYLKRLFLQNSDPQKNYRNLLLNEICTQNKKCLLDCYGQASDWMEFYNDGDFPIDLSGCGLSDDSSDPFQWTFPENTILSSREYLIVFASKRNSTETELHTNFALSKNGETVLLSSPNGDVLQRISVPSLAEDSTYGRSPNGSATWSIMEPTPGSANELTISAPKFSNSSGFYSDDFSLTLQTDQQDAVIYYTLDGSDPYNMVDGKPALSESAMPYTEPISMYDRSSEPNVYSSYQHSKTAQSITLEMPYYAPNYAVDKATVVRAVTVGSNGAYSSIITNTYLIADSDKLNRYQDISVVSLVTDPVNLFDAETGIYVSGQQYLDWKNSSDYDASIDEWNTKSKANFYSKGREWERPVSFELFENGVRMYQQNMGIRIKGASTRNSPQKSFNLFARGDYGNSKLEYPIFKENRAESTGKNIKKYDSITLRAMTNSSPIRIRDKLSQELLDGRDMSTQNTKPCFVFLDGEYWGLYEFYEKYSDYYVQTHYDIPKEQVAMIKNGELEEGTSSDWNNFYSICQYASKHDVTDPTVYQYICDRMDIQSLIEQYCTGIYLGTVDWPNYNYAVWRYTGEPIDGNSYADGKWRFMVMDLDYSMGLTYSSFDGVEGYAYDNFQYTQKSNTWMPTDLFDHLLANSDFAKQFALTYQDYANELFSPKRVNPVLEQYQTEYFDWSMQGLKRWNAWSANQRSYEESFSLIRIFFTNRAAYTLEDMAEYLNLSGSLEPLQLQTNGSGSIQVNTVTPDFSGGTWNGQYYSDFPVTLTAVPSNGQTFIGWSGDYDSTDTTITVSLQDAMQIQANFSNGNT